MNTEPDQPRWDVALAAMAAEEYRKNNAALRLDDFRQLAKQHAIRLDDIMETMFLLAINGEWSYTDTSGEQQELDQDTLDSLYVKRRLSEADLEAFNGAWRPC